MSGWLPFNERLNNIKEQLTTFANNVLADDEEADLNIISKEEIIQICKQKDLEIEQLKKANEDLKSNSGNNAVQNGQASDSNWDWTPPEPPEDVSALKNTISVLQREKDDLVNKLDELDADFAKSVGEIVTIRDNLQRENADLKEENAELKQQIKRIADQSRQDEATQEKYDKYLKTNQELQIKLQDTLNELAVLRSTHETLKKAFNENQKNDQELEDLKSKLKKSERELKLAHKELQKADEFVKLAEVKAQEDTENCQKLALILESYEKQVSSLNDELKSASKSDLEQENLQLKTKLREADESKNILDQQLDALKKKLEEKENLHNKYISIITDNIRKYTDTTSLSEQHFHTSEDPHVIEFNRHVENLCKILLELKIKCETLEKQLIDIANEKADILNDKNNEIEKLMENSDILSQEVIKKGETIKELESEVTSLITSNDLLLIELDSFKNSGLLPSISESNEDNMVLLETDLENANKRIKELEEIIDSPCRSSMSNKSVDENEDYQKLLNNFDRLKIDYDEAVLKLNETCQELDKRKTENEELKGNLDKLKSDFENADYQLTEANFTLDSLQEELEAFRSSNKVLEKQNEELKFQNKQYIDMKSQLNEVKEKWLSEEQLRKELEVEVKSLIEKQQKAKMTETSLKLQFDNLNKEHTAIVETKNDLEQSLTSAKASMSDYERNYTELLQKYDDVLVRCEELNTKLHEYENELLKLQNNQQPNDTPINQAELQEENKRLQVELKQSQDNISLLQQQLQELAKSRNELVNMVTIKHQESVNYHAEIQRLSEVLNIENQKNAQLESKLMQASDMAQKSATIDELNDQINFLKEKCDMLTKNLLEAESKYDQLLAQKSDKEVSLAKQLERLQAHLMELEEHYTQELLQAEHKNAELQSRVTDLELREKNSNTMYTSVSIRANQQVESLQSQLQMVTSQREELRKQISDAEDLNNKQAAALANLQFVLEQFQKEKEKDVHMETERIRKQITAEKQVQDELRKEIENLKAQLEESRIGLQAASRLSDQLELLKKQNMGLKDEVSQLQQKLAKTQETVKELNSQTDGKIDKTLIKSLIVGFLTSGSTSNWNKDQAQVLKLIATVLDFNQQDHDKVKLNQRPQGSWFGSILHPQPADDQNLSQESLSQAFVRFLENESKPRVVPSLLSESKSGENDGNSKKSTPRTTPSPIVLNEVVLPTFADFGQSRNSSSILKDVLKDNNT